MSPVPRALAVLPALLLHLSVGAGLGAAVEPAAKLSFNRDVRPILSDKCFACHGFDPHTRKADLRLDTPEGATEEINGVRAIVPGDLSKSEAWLRIVSEDKDEVMPPPKSHKTLNAAEKKVLKQWITEGAHYQKHWSFEPPQRAALPQVRSKGWVRNPIDSFVLASLVESGLQPAAEADRRTLARRLSLDLTGLPPKPAQVEAFVEDKSPQSYEKLVRHFDQWAPIRRFKGNVARFNDHSPL